MEGGEEQARQLEALGTLSHRHSAHTRLQQAPVVGGEEWVWQLAQKLLQNAGHIVDIAVTGKRGGGALQQSLKSQKFN